MQIAANISFEFDSQKAKSLAGRGARRGSDAVGRATTRAVVAGLLAAIAVELIFSMAGGLLR